jgi:hypothetical protein
MVYYEQLTGLISFPGHCLLDDRAGFVRLKNLELPHQLNPPGTHPIANALDGMKSNQSLQQNLIKWQGHTSGFM